MLPDLRVLLIATASTFLVAIGAAFFVSVHVLPDPLNPVQPERGTPVNRMSNGWHDTGGAAPDLAPVSPRPKDISPPQPKAETGPLESVAIDTPAPVNAAPAVPADTGPTPDKDTPPSADKNAVSQEADTPEATGSIGEPAPLPVPAPARTRPELAARPDPADKPQESTAPKPQIATPPAVAQKPARPARKHRVVKQDPFGFPANSPAAADPNYNFFIDFGSRMR